MLSSVVAPPADCLTALVEAAERLATTDERPGSARLWAAEEGRALAGLIAEARAAWAVLPEQRKSVLPGLLDALLEGVVVRTRRGIRGREGAEHPRVFIWGLLEARLQTVDTVVLGGLAEGAWPPATDPGPWLSRPMRARVGLLSPEHRVGQAAHDFFTAACAARTVVLSSPRRRDGAPAVPARWLVRLDAFLAGSGASLPRHPATDWARMLDRPVNGAQPALPPAPRPPVALRPRRLSVTEIEKWLRDPYAIYARHVLKLARLDPLDQDSDAADYGAIVHEALHRFIGKHGLDWPREAPELLQQDMQHALDRAEIRPALAAWWRPRLLRIADWVANVEAKRRQAGAPLEVATEVAGEWEIARPRGPFGLRARADRIERRSDGTLIIIDYKTGAPPSQRDVDAGYAAQLPLEAAMAEVRAFGEGLTGAASELIYWHVNGAREGGRAIPLCKGDRDELSALIAKSRDGLLALIDRYDDPAQPYLSHPYPSHKPRFADYAQLARVPEWSAAEDVA
ncbi:MAG: double-strand break repair protein AddB [Acetobacteraceae bacterium]|nr:double-strand break repair protein AddB [Acetobacteraceae bacterium]